MSGGDAVLYYASKGRLRRRLRASTSIASKYNARYNAVVAGGGGGGGNSLARTTSGILLYDDFSSALSGNWSVGQGTWSTSGGNLSNTSAGNFDRIHNTTVSVASAMYEMRAKAPSNPIYIMLACLVASGTSDWHVDAIGQNNDKALAYNGTSDTRAATLTFTMDTTNFHVLKMLYIPTKHFVVWHNHVAGIGSGTIAVPFDASAGTGPTAAGNPGIMAYGGAILVDWYLVSSDYKITVTGLTGTQAFRLFASGGATIGSSAAQTAGSATLDISSLVDGLTTGYIEVHPDTSFASMQARYPGAGDSTDIAGGDSYAFS